MSSTEILNIISPSLALPSGFQLAMPAVKPSFVISTVFGRKLIAN